MSYICITIINSAMKLRLDPNSTQPLHQQAEDLLRTLILKKWFVSLKSTRLTSC